MPMPMDNLRGHTPRSAGFVRGASHDPHSRSVDRTDTDRLNRPSRASSSTGGDPRQAPPLDPSRKCPEVTQLEHALKARVVGQGEAITQIVSHYQTYLAGLAPEGRPICNLLLLGPTGCGKTRTVEALAEALAGDKQALIKVDCGEFQHSHEIAKLIGSPPGYLGHRETHPRLCQEKLDLYHTDHMKLSFVLFDEIEKASDALWNLLLGILDKGTLTLGDNRHVDFSQTMVFLTGNLGTAEAQRLRELPWGFAAGPPAALPCPAMETPAAAARHSQAAVHTNPALPDPLQTDTLQTDTLQTDAVRTNWTGNGRHAAPDSQPLSPAPSLAGTSASAGGFRMPPAMATGSPQAPLQAPQHGHRSYQRGNGHVQGNNGDGDGVHGDTALGRKMEKAVLDAAKRKFSPEFLNRLDRIILCHPLDRQQIAAVLDLEIQGIVMRIDRQRRCCLQVSVSDDARDFLVQEGFDPNRGARNLKRSVERHLVQPLSSLLATHQLQDGDELLVDLASDGSHLEFRRGIPVSTSLALRQLASRWNTAPARPTDP